MGQKQKTEKERRERERERERKLMITMAKLCMAHAGTHGARKPPGPKLKRHPYSLHSTEILCSPCVNISAWELNNSFVDIVRKIIKAIHHNWHIYPWPDLTWPG